MSNSWSLIANFTIWVILGLILFAAGLLQQESHFTVSCLIHFDSLVDIMLWETLDCVFFLWTVLILLLQAVYLFRLKLWDGQQLNSLFNDLSLPYVAPGDFPVHAYIEGLPGVWMEFMCRFRSSPLFVSLFSQKSLYNFQPLMQPKLYLLTPWASKTLLHFQVWKVPPSEKVFNCFTSFRESSYLHFYLLCSCFPHAS